MKYRADIQGLRAIAVIFVLLFHFNRDWLPGGFIGVDIFFVISGFLITSIIVHKKEKNTFSFKGFYLSRIKRIVPAFYVLLFFVSIAATFIMIGSDLENYKSCLKNTIFFNSNNYFKHLDTYFGAGSNELPLLHTWTLAIEMQFYLFLPLIVIFTPRKYLLAVLLIIFLGLGIYTQYNLDILGNKDTMYFSILSRSMEFMVGSIVSIIKVNKEGKLFVVQFVGLVVLIISGIIINEASDFPGLLALLPCIGTALLICYNGGFITKILSTKPMVLIGELSYSLYLWHWPIFAFIRYKLQTYHIPYDIGIVAVIVTFLVSWCSYQLIEQKSRKITDKRMVVTLALSICLLLGINYASSNFNKNLYPLPKNMVTPFGLGMVSHSGNYEKDTIRGDAKGKDTLLLLGDSHALFLNTFLDDIGKQDSFAFHSVTNDTYPTIWGIDTLDIGNNGYKIRYLKLSRIAKDLVKNSKVIVFSRFWGYPIPSFYKAFEKFLDSLQPDQHLIFISDVPKLNENPVRLTKSIVKDADSKQLKSMVDPTPQRILNLIRKHKNVVYLDLSKSAAFEDAPYYHDTLMYYDAHHLNVFGAEVYAKFSKEKFTRTLDSLKALRTL